VQEFKIETDSLSKRHEAIARLRSWAAVLSLIAISILIFVLGSFGLLRVDSQFRWLAWLAVPSLLGAVIGASILVCREALRRAEREMVFALDDNAIVRKRKGFPDIRIAFSEVDSLGDELRWLVVKSTVPRRKIAVPNDVRGFEMLRAELAKHHTLSARVKLPLKSFTLIVISILSWAAVLWLHDLRIVIPAGVIALTLLALGCHRLWTVFPDGQKRLFLFVCLCIVWLTAILLICFRAPDLVVGWGVLK
jgi:FtsH-binding integral membrane protein